MDFKQYQVEFIHGLNDIPEKDLETRWKQWEVRKELARRSCWNQLDATTYPVEIKLRSQCPWRGNISSASCEVPQYLQVLQ